MQLTHRRFTDRYPLRVTIVVVLLTLVALALIASGVLATTIMRGYLTDRFDELYSRMQAPGVEDKTIAALDLQPLPQLSPRTKKPRRRRG